MSASLTYTGTPAGGCLGAVLRSDGRALAGGDYGQDQCDVPVLAAGPTYTQAAAGGSHSVLLSSYGTAEACGDNRQDVMA